MKLLLLLLPLSLLLVLDGAVDNDGADVVGTVAAAAPMGNTTSAPEALMTPKIFNEDDVVSATNKRRQEDVDDVVAVVRRCPRRFVIVIAIWLLAEGRNKNER